MMMMMAHNYWAFCPARHRRIGTPSWIAALRYRVYRLCHRKEYRPAVREEYCW